jgi:selenium metabolism protein YedF
MNVKTVDARGIPCPQPVILTRNAMREADEVITLVNARDSLDNVRRLAEKGGWRVTVEEREGAWALHMVKGQTAGEPVAREPAAGEPELTADLAACAVPDAEAQPPTRARRAVLVVSSEGMGRGNEELAGILARTFFHVLTESDAPPATIVFFNAGVKLVVEGSPVLDDLRALAARGVEMLACGVCLNYFSLRDKVAVGVVSNMYTISETMFGAQHIVSL